MDIPIDVEDAVVTIAAASAGAVVVDVVILHWVYDVIGEAHTDITEWVKWFVSYF